MTSGNLAYFVCLVLPNSTKTVRVMQPVQNKSLKKPKAELMIGLHNKKVSFAD